MANTKDPAQTSFKQAYQVLQKHSQNLRNNNEPNIDELLTIVNESMQAYKVCKTRIDAVEKALSQALQGEDIDFDINDINKSASDEDDDVPF